MRLLFVTPEVTPYSGASPVGDACWALPKALRARGHEVTILAPLYGFIDPSARGLARRLRKVVTKLGDDVQYAFEVYDARTAAGIDVVFLGHEALFRPCRAVPTGADPEDGLRFGAFCRAAIEVAQNADKPFHVVHCHEWQAALVPVLLRTSEVDDLGSVLTVHDVRGQGIFGPELVARLGLPRELFGIEGLEFFGKTCLLKGGVLYADRVTTVSPSYAKEITRTGAGGLEGVFGKRGKELVGITGGVDVAVWNPATDAYLEARFDPMDLSGKRRNKAALQRELGLPIRDDVPLIGVLGPLHPSSGLDVLARIVSRVMRNDVQVAIVPEGQPTDESLVTVLEEHSRRWPDRLVLRAQAGEALVHRTLAGSDLVLVPPHQPPGGSLQMRAHRYGALPIGHARGAVADTVVDCDAKLTTGNGFLCTSAEDEAVLAAVQRATAAFAMRSAFEKVRARAMRTDHSWERSAYLYERLYESI
ncbi:MAG TPA: glycogen/starch synthase [Sandaracinaceae bacterium]